VHDGRSITLWNWREDKICNIEDDRDEWADGSDFSIATSPPYIFIFPRRDRRIFVVEIGPLYPAGSSASLDPTRPVSKFLYQFLNDGQGIGTSNVYIMDRWKPQSHRSEKVILRLTPEPGTVGSFDGPFCMVSLSPTDAAVPIPLYTKGSWLESDYNETLTPINGVGVVHLFPAAWVGDRVPLVTEFYRFSESGGLVAPVRREFENVFLKGGDRMKLCFVSGTALLERRMAGPELYTQKAEILSFDFQDAENL
ncbi:hypothetical protein DL93DRAFT_2103175, partial [Clavulina sp. PMI_390]